jgi:ADP-ribose pyrophosphatase YjhB (NUDIX family)
MSDGIEKWLGWAREIQALAKSAEHFAKNSYDRERAERLMQIAAEIIAEHSEMTEKELLTAFRAQPGYMTPKVDVRGAVFDGEKLLFVREAADHCWTFPGGWADVGETPSLAVEREVREESGVEVRAERLIGVYDANRVESFLPLFHAYKLVFFCRPLSGEPKPSNETLEVGYFSLDDLPEPLSAHRTTPRHIEDAIEALRNPTSDTAFD